MNDCWVIVADGARARFMAVERHTAVPPRAALRLVESAKLSNPEHTVEGLRAMRKIKSGRDTGRGRMEPHSYTDKREPHEAEVLRRFASRIAEQATALVTTGKASSIVLVDVAEESEIEWQEDCGALIRSGEVTMMNKPKAGKRAARVVVTPEERYRLINDAAYFREAKLQRERGKPQDAAGSWCEVEAEIDTVLKQHHAK